MPPDTATTCITSLYRRCKNKSAFVDNYKPYEGAQDVLPYNFYNADEKMWQFSKKIDANFKRWLGPQLDFDGHNNS